MALTLNITNVPFRDKLADRLVRQALLTGPSSYATGGIAIDNQGDFGWGETYGIIGFISDGTTYYGLFLDFTNQKVKAINLADGVEVANLTNLSTFAGYITAFGR